MKEDPNIIREGFIINENVSVSENEQKLYSASQQVSGHDLLVTNESSKSKENSFKERVEGHNVVITQQKS